MILNHIGRARINNLCPVREDRPKDQRDDQMEDHVKFYKSNVCLLADIEIKGRDGIRSVAFNCYSSDTNIKR